MGQLAQFGSRDPRPRHGDRGSGLAWGRKQSQVQDLGLSREARAMPVASEPPALLISLSVSPRPSSPAGFPDPLGRHASGDATFAAPPVLPSRPTTSRAPPLVSLALMESLPSVPPEDPGSSPGVTP